MKERGWLAGKVRLKGSSQDRLSLQIIAIMVIMRHRFSLERKREIKNKIKTGQERRLFVPKHGKNRISFPILPFLWSILVKLIPF